MTTPSNMTDSHDADMNDDGLADTFSRSVCGRRSPLRASIERTMPCQAVPCGVRGADRHQPAVRQLPEGSCIRLFEGGKFPQRPDACDQSDT